MKNTSIVMKLPECSESFGKESDKKQIRVSILTEPGFSRSKIKENNYFTVTYL